MSTSLYLDGSRNYILQNYLLLLADLLSLTHHDPDTERNRELADEYIGADHTEREAIGEDDTDVELTSLTSSTMNLMMASVMSSTMIWMIWLQ